jgi:hypothetical protein
VPSFPVVQPDSNHIIEVVPEAVILQAERIENFQLLVITFKGQDLSILRLSVSVLWSHSARRLRFLIVFRIPHSINWFWFILRIMSPTKPKLTSSRSGGRNGATDKDREGNEKDGGNSGHLPLNGLRAKLIHDFKLARPFWQFANHGEWIRDLLTFLHQKDPEIKYEDLVCWDEKNQWISTFEVGGKGRRNPWSAEFESLSIEADTEAMAYVPFDNSDSSLGNLVLESSSEVSNSGNNFEIASPSGGVTLLHDNNLELTADSASAMAGTSASFYPMLRQGYLSSVEVLRQPPSFVNEETDNMTVAVEPEPELRAQSPNPTRKTVADDDDENWDSSGMDTSSEEENEENSVDSLLVSVFKNVNVQKKKKKKKGFIDSWEKFDLYYAKKAIQKQKKKKKMEKLNSIANSRIRKTTSSIGNFQNQRRNFQA